MRDSDRIIGLLDTKTAKAEHGERIEKHLLITRYDPLRAARGDMMKSRTCSTSFRCRSLGSFRKVRKCCGRPNRLAGHVEQRASAPARAYPMPFAGCAGRR